MEKMTQVEVSWARAVSACEVLGIGSSFENSCQSSWLHGGTTPREGSFILSCWHERRGQLEGGQSIVIELTGGLEMLV